MPYEEKLSDTFPAVTTLYLRLVTCSSARAKPF